MTLQSFIVALLVLGCSVYAAWSLMPSAARRAIAVRLLKFQWPGALAAPLRRAAAASSGCGCDGCDRAAPIAPTARNASPTDATQGSSQTSSSQAKPIVFHRRVR